MSDEPKPPRPIRSPQEQAEHDKMWDFYAGDQWTPEQIEQFKRRDSKDSQKRKS